MPSKVFMICNSYESGYGHGLANDGLDLSKTPHADPEQGEAYQIGYEEGCAAARRGKHLPATIHSAKECSEAFEWLRAEATRDGAPPQAGIALDEWHALTMAATHNAELYVAVEET